MKSTEEWANLHGEIVMSRNQFDEEETREKERREMIDFAEPDPVVFTLCDIIRVMSRIIDIGPNQELGEEWSSLYRDLPGWVQKIIEE